MPDTAAVEVSGSEMSVDTVSEGLELVMPQSSPVSIRHRDTGTSEFVSGRTLGPVAGVLASSRRSVRQVSCEYMSAHACACVHTCVQVCESLNTCWNFTTFYMGLCLFTYTHIHTGLTCQHCPRRQSEKNRTATGEL